MALQRTDRPPISSESVAATTEPARTESPVYSVATATSPSSLDLIEQIRTQGYCRIPAVYTPAQTKQALVRLQQLYQEGQEQLTENIPFLNRNHPMVYNLENKDFDFLTMLFAPQQVHAVLRHFLNDKWYRAIPAEEPNYILRSFLARSSNDALPLHIDSFMPYVTEESFIMQLAIILEDQDEENGCTIVLPGSHQSGEYADRSRADECVPIYSKAGDIVIWDSRLWHGTLANVSANRTRWSIIATFGRWWIKQNFNMVENVPQAIYDRLTPGQKAMLGFSSIPFSDETQGIDFKQGFDALLPDVTDYRSARQYHPG